LKFNNLLLVVIHSSLTHLFHDGQRSRVKLTLWLVWSRLAVPMELRIMLNYCWSG